MDLVEQKNDNNYTFERRNTGHPFLLNVHSHICQRRQLAEHSMHTGDEPTIFGNMSTQKKEYLVENTWRKSFIPA